MADHKPKSATKLAHLGRDPQRFAGAVNPPPFRMSTVLAPDFETYTRPGRKFEREETVYGRYGTPTHDALENLLSELEGGADTMLLPAGLSAITTALFAVLQSGDELLMTDSAYGPTRQFCDKVLSKLGITTTYIPPTLTGEALAGYIGPATRALFLESPGSMTFEVQDVPGLAAAAKARGLTVLMDNTWATPLYFRPLAHGVDMSIQAGTKYIVGHADAMIGSVTSNEAWARTLRETAYYLGNSAGSEETYLALRGVRTLDVRLPRHWENGVLVARWLQSRPEVAEALHPALQSHPQHKLWARDFDGASGLFAFVLNKPYGKAALAALVDGLEYFGIGSSWGGFESLIVPGFPPPTRTASKLPEAGPLVRLHVGLEDPDDLIRDLGAGLDRLAAVGP
jgi:cystathionine beta-lyase